MEQEQTIPTFSEQATWWLHNIQTRKRNPIKPSSAAQFQSHLNFLIPIIGATPLSEVNNGTLKKLIPSIKGSPKTVQCYIATVKSVVASALDDDGEPRFARKWNAEYMDLPEVDKQKTPMFSSEQIADMLKLAGRDGMLYKLAAGSGLRIGELLALEPKHFNGRTLTVEQSLWGDTIQTPKTKNAFRDVDLAAPLAEELKENLRGRTTGYIVDEPRSYGGVLANLHDVLDTLKIERTGFHAFRRYRKTHLGKNHVPRDLVRYWMGHADGDVTDKYDKIEQDLEFRLAEATRVGLGF